MRRRIHFSFLMMAVAFLTAFAVAVPTEPAQAQVITQTCVNFLLESNADSISEMISEVLNSASVRNAKMVTESEAPETLFDESEMIETAEIEEGCFFSDDEECSSTGFVARLKKIAVQAYIAHHVLEFQKSLSRTYSRYHAQVEYWKEIALN